MKVRSLSSVRLFATLWTVAHQASLSVGFSRQEYWRSGLPFSSPGDLPTPKIKFGSPTFWADSLLCESPGHQGLITIILQLRYIEIINNNAIILEVFSPSSSYRDRLLVNRVKHTIKSPIVTEL